MFDANYRDFYQKALIPIGSNDFSRLTESSAGQSIHSHWLIALEGQLKSQEKEFYSWRVSVFPSDANGSFSWKNPFYTSSLYDCIHKADEHARDIEKCSKSDQLFTKNRQEKIS